MLSEPGRYTIERSVRGGDVSQKFAPSWGLNHRVGSTKTAEPIEMPFFKELAHAGSKNNVLVGWALWRHRVNTIEFSADVAAKRHSQKSTAHTGPTARMCATAPPLSAADELECHIKFASQRSPAMRPFVKILWTTCYYY